MPDSSWISRRTASSIVSPGSRKPANAEYMPSAKRRRAAEQTSVAVYRQHDHDWVDARKMLRVAGFAIASPTGRGRNAWLAAIGAKTVTLMPVGQRFRRTEFAQHGRRDQAASRHRAQLDGGQRRARGDRVDESLVKKCGEHRRTLQVLAPLELRVDGLVAGAIPLAGARLTGVFPIRLRFAQIQPEENLAVRLSEFQQLILRKTMDRARHPAS